MTFSPVRHPSVIGDYWRFDSRHALPLPRGRKGGRPKPVDDGDGDGGDATAEPVMPDSGDGVPRRRRRCPRGVKICRLFPSIQLVRGGHGIRGAHVGRGGVCKHQAGRPISLPSPFSDSPDSAKKNELIGIPEKGVGETTATVLLLLLPN